MARHWGGDGIEEFLQPGENVILRFRNFFLTDIQLGLYHTLGSRFEFTRLSGLTVKVNKAGYVKTFIAIFLALTAVSIGMDVVYYSGNILFILASMAAWSIGIGNIWVIYRWYVKDSYVASSMDPRKRWVIRTLTTPQGQIFMDELVKAVNIKKSAMN